MKLYLRRTLVRSVLYGAFTEANVDGETLSTAKILFD